MSPSDHTDNALFERFLAGDDTAFLLLFRRHNPRLYLYCSKIVGSRTEASDILQDVWERMARFRPEGREAPTSPLGLLIRTTRNLAINHLKRRGRTVSLDSGEGTIHRGEQAEELSEMEEAVVMALDRLPIEQREVLVLNAYCGYQYQEIAEMLEEEPAAVRTRAWRARTRLARIIAELIGARADNEKSDITNRRSEGEQ